MANKRIDQLTALAGTVSLLDLIPLWDVSSGTTVQTTVQKLADAVPTQPHNHVKSEITDFAHGHVKADISDFAHGHVKADISDFTHTHVKAEVTDFAHNHTKAEITDFTHTHTKSEVTDFAHTHVKADVTDFTHTHTKTDITDFAHTHVKADITDFAHTHVKADITDFAHTHTKAEITDFAHTHSDATNLASGFMSSTDKTKLDGIATGATANATDGFLLSRANHTGTQTAATVSDFNEAAQDATAAALLNTSTVNFTYNDGSNQISANVNDNSITDAKLRTSSATSVVGRSGSTSGNVADIIASADGQYLRRAGGSLGFGVININDLNDVVITSPSTGQVIKFNGTNWINDVDAGGAGSGDNITVNGVAALDADFDDATPAAPNAASINVKWQKDSGTPNNISAYLTGMPVVLDREASLLTVTNTTTETTIFTHSVPANVMGTDRMLRCTIIGTHLNNSAVGATLTVRAKFGGTTWYADLSASFATSTTERPINWVFWVANRGASNVQFCAAQLGMGNTSGTTTGRGDFAAASQLSQSSMSSNGTMAIDTTAAQTFEITIQHTTATATQTFSRQYAVLELV